jgi:hypothetical protein
MKTKIFIGLLAVSTLFIASCGKEGPQGPAGPAGPAGPTGPQGTNAVVYSNWTNFTPASWGAFNGLGVASYNITAIAALTQTIVDRGAVKVFIKRAGNTTQAWPLPLLDQTAADVFNLDYLFGLNQITVRCTDLAGSPNPTALLASFAQYRYVLIPAGVAGVAAGGSSNAFYNGYTRQQLNQMSYTDLCTALQIPQ